MTYSKNKLLGLSALLIVLTLGTACEPEQPLDQPPPGEVSPTQPNAPGVPPADPVAPPEG